MRIVTGLETIKQQITDSNFNQREIDWVQDGIDYIERLEEQLDKIKRWIDNLSCKVNLTESEKYIKQILEEVK